MRYFPRLLGSILAAFSTGCYVAAPLTTPIPVVGSRVELTLTDAGSQTMASQLGPGKAELVGDVTAASDSTITLALRTVTSRRGIDETWLGEQVTVPNSAVASMGLRRVSVFRSVLLATGALLAVIGIGLAITTAGSGVDRDIGGNPQ